LFLEIEGKLKGKPCLTYGIDVRSQITADGLFTYPDISIYCSGLNQSNIDEESFVELPVIIEILSPSTRDYDRRHKFDLYKDISNA